MRNSTAGAIQSHECHWWGWEMNLCIDETRRDETFSKISDHLLNQNRD